jgi:hypothetical protein
VECQAILSGNVKGGGMEGDRSTKGGIRQEKKEFEYQ